MTSPIEQPQTPAALAHARATAAAEAAYNGPCDRLEPAGLQCSLVVGHPGRCVPEPNVTEPPASDPTAGSAPAAFVAPEEEPEPAPPPRPRKYGFSRPKEHDIELPSGAYVRVRQLSSSEVIELGLINMKDSFGADLLKVFESLEDGDPESMQLAAEQAEAWAKDPDRSGQLIEMLNRVLAATVVCPRVVLAGDTTDEQINASHVELADKWAIFDAVMPDELKSAAQGAQLAALKSVRR